MQVAKYDNNPDKLLGTMYYYVQVLDTHSLTYLTYLVTVYLPTHLLTTSHYLPTHIQQSEQRRGWSRRRSKYLLRSPTYTLSPYYYTI